MLMNNNFQVEVATYRNFVSSVLVSLKVGCKSFGLPHDKETFEELEASIDWKKFNFMQTPKLYPEKALNYICQGYLKAISDGELVKNNKILQEIMQYRNKFQDQSFLNYLLIELYDRTISIQEYLERVKNSPGMLSASIRYLFILLQSFDELKRQKVDDADKTANILLELINRQTDDQQLVESADKQILYYLLKVSDLIVVPGRKQLSMIGREKEYYSMLDIMKPSEELIKTLGQPGIWNDYFRENEYFHRNNSTLFQQIRIRTAKKGLEQLSEQDDIENESLKLLKTIYSEKGMLTQEGRLALTLNDVIRFMISLKLGLSKINVVCKTLTITYNMDKKLAYAVFRETEDEFSFKGYNSICKVDASNVSRCLSLPTFDYSYINKLIPYLRTKDGFEYCLTSKKHRAKGWNTLIKTTLYYYQIDREQRIILWLALLSDEQLQRTLRKDVSSQSQKFPIIECDLNRSKKFFKEGDYEKVENILVNIAIDYPKLEYFQGLNYICIYLFKTFNKDAENTYRFLSYVVESLLMPRFSKEFEGMMEFVFLNDKFLQMTNKRIWKKYQQSQVSTLHFGVSALITVFAIFIKKKRNYPLINTAWDLVLSGGFVEQMKLMMYILKLQETSIIDLPLEKVLMGHQKFDKNPFSILYYANERLTGKDVEKMVCSIKKKIVHKKIKITNGMFERLVSHYYKVHQPILNFWSLNVKND